MSLEKEYVIEFLSGLSILELSELVKEFENTFQVKRKNDIEPLKNNHLQKKAKTKIKKCDFERNFFRGK